MTVKSSGIYVFGINVDHLNVGAFIFLYLPPQTRASGLIAADAEEEAYAFFDDEGNRITRVPANKHVNTAMYMEAGETYAPILTTSAPQKMWEVPAAADATPALE